MAVRYLAAGDRCVVAEFGKEIDAAVNKKVHQFNHIVKKRIKDGIVDTVPTYRSLLIHFDPAVFSFNRFVNELKDIEKTLDSAELPPSFIATVPVCYGGELGPDLEDMAGLTGLSVEEVVRIHTSVDYLIFCLGFTPGFPFLGGMDQRIAAPRLTNPRTHVPRGSVGIGGKQTGIYPQESPGGWRLLGRTPVKLFELREGDTPFFPLKPGNYIRFKPITLDEYHSIKEQVTQGEYQWDIKEYSAD